MRPFTGTGLISALAMALEGQLPQPPLQARGTPSGAPGSRALEAQLATVRRLAEADASAAARTDLINAHHTLLGLYWRTVARDRVATLPSVSLLDGNGRFSGCGQARRPNAYCPESSEIILSTRGLQRSQRFSNAKRTLLGITVLAHEWGHHVNHHSARGRFPRNEEDAADWRAGRYMAWLMRNRALEVKDFTDAANLFFSIGDFHLQSPHSNPKARYDAFIAGVGDELTPGLRIGAWTMDTPDTFSRLLEPTGNGGQTAAGRPAALTASLTAEVYRFEIERGKQIAGNLFSAVLGVINCRSGSSGACANALLNQGQAMPEGWYRLRTMRIDCERGDFDIDNDGIRRQPWEGDRKGQAAVIAARACSDRQRRSHHDQGLPQAMHGELGKTGHDPRK